MSNSNQTRHSGVVLLVVLGMLSLFSVLIVSYLVFSSQMRDTAFAASSRRLSEMDPDFAFDAAIASLVSGTDDSASAAFGHSLLEDLYGTDGLLLRVGHQRGGGPMSPDARGRLLRPLAPNDQPRSTLFKFPTSLAAWFRDGSPAPDDASTLTSPLPPNLRPDLDDVFSGRLVTFLDGPLQGGTFRIIRSFGNGNTGTPVENALAGCFVIDLSEFSDEQIEFEDLSESLYDIAANAPDRLLYSVGEDGEPGRAGLSDDGDNATDEFDELGYPGSDDVGYRFVLNGQVFNGRGQNPDAQTGIQRNGIALDAAADIELQPNATLMGASVSGGTGGTFPQPDEQYDAPDFENMYLAWQPSDHRRSYNQTVYTGTGAAELNRQLGQHVIPSFHRPAIINYLMNAPIRLPGDAAGFERNFAQLTGDNSSPNRDVDRLMQLLTRLRRATMRPLNFEHVYFNAAQSDLNGDGSPFDGAPGFSGANPTPILSETIETSSADFATLKAQVQSLAVWLINGPWDVDNDGDGLPDSVWVDLNLPAVQSPDGKLIKPLVAPLIEDLDGRINVNVAGNYRQIRDRRFPANNPQQFNTDPEYFSATTSLNVFGRGGGLGPAEIDFSHLFDEGTTFSSPQIGPVYRNQLSAGSNNVLLTRYGNLLNVRYGGQPFNYISPYPPSVFTKLPGLGDFANPLPNRDLLARIPFPARTAWHTASSPYGHPVDMAGRSMNRQDRFGNQVFDNMSSAENSVGFNEIANQPYESGIDLPRGDDTPFTPAEFHDFLRGGQLAGRLSTLLGDAADSDESLRRILTTESRSLNVPEVLGHPSIINFIAAKLTAGGVASNVQQPHLDRMLAVELRKGSKLNLNRALGNGQQDDGDNVVDDSDETRTQLISADPQLPNEAPNRRAAESAYPQIAGEYPQAATAAARYTTTTARSGGGTPDDFNGLDYDGDGVLELGDDVNGDGIKDRIATGNELLARHLYCLMFSLVADPGGSPKIEHFPYPDGFSTNNGVRDRYAARRIAQWAVNAVDYRDTDAAMTRLRYDPNPFDGFDLDVAAENVVWGMERPELELTETIAFHDKRLKRNLEKAPDPEDPTLTIDGQLPTDEDPDSADAKEPDEDMDQFRIPEASAFVELRSLRSPVINSGEVQPSFPPELYTTGTVPRLDLGRVVGSGNSRSPVWRLAVGQPTGAQRERSTRWTYDAQRVASDSTVAPDVEYLQAPGEDWSDTDSIDTQIETWNEARRHAAEVRPLNDPSVAAVTISDDDFNPANDTAAGNASIRLERFVWFAKLQPDAALTVLSDPGSGMRLDNVFFNSNDLAQGGDAKEPENASPMLAPGQFAVVGPRQTTLFGQTADSVAPTYEWHPVSQRFQFANHGGTAGEFTFRFYDLNDTNSSPRYREDDNNAYDVNVVLPITATSLYPHQVVGGRADWSNYVDTLTNGAPEDRVGIGFNISAPLAGAGYYTAPTARITENGPNDEYPLVDGYRNYDTSTGFHPDQPLDHAAGTPMEDNGWNAVGTHQEARTVFLQRLADPSAPWHATDNPYLTVDFMPMDLTTFNGEYDVREMIDRDGDGAANELVDDKTDWDPDTGEFTPAVKFDSRRKIPDVDRDRALTSLAPTTNSPGSDLGNYERIAVTERTSLTSTFSILRNAGEQTGSNAFWNFELGALWENENPKPIATPPELNTAYAVNLTFDKRNDPFRQTLGFVNREYGNPLRSNSPLVASLGLGLPADVTYNNLAWMDRDYRSPLELMNVPASSRTGLLTTFSPGTILQDDGKREVPTHFDHLLGFEADVANYRGADESSLTKAGSATTNPADLTGERAGFEVIFDFVDVGAVWYDQNRWFDPQQISMIRTDNVSGIRDRMFNRVVESLQPPFNYVGRHRTPGRVNLNTMPDYIRKGGENWNAPSSSFDQIPALARRNGFLDLGEAPSTPGLETTTENVGAVVYSRGNAMRTGDGFTENFLQADLYGNGSIFRSLAWGISAPYELDGPFSVSGGKFINRIPMTLGDAGRNQYAEAVDTRFGFGFKALIESRRGYPSTAPAPVTSPIDFGNPVLDWRYPTRFAGMFAPSTAAQLPGVQRFGRIESETAATTGLRRRTHDMTVLRPHPDFDLRTKTSTERTAIETEADTSYSLKLEEAPGGVTVPALNPSPPEIAQLRSPLVNRGLFERPSAELHQNFRHLDRDSHFRFENAARMANLTTHHSNVFMVRLTIGYFVVDPVTGAVGEEYTENSGERMRPRAFYLIDRSKPVGFMRGVNTNALETIIYSSREK